MAENIKILKIVEQFISNKCLYKKEKNISYKINYHNLGQNNLSILYDNTHFIPCIINNQKELEELSKINNDSYLLIKDYKLDLIFYKSDIEPKYIQCSIIFIINDFSIINKEKEEKEEENNFILFDKEKNIDINKEERITKKLRKFLFDFIKKKETKNITLDNLFLENSKNNIKSFNNNNIEQYDDYIKNLNYDIKMKEGKNIEEILDVLNPELKEELITKYISEMPDEIDNLQKKYKKIKFNKEIYKNYIENNKNKNNEN